MRQPVRYRYDTEIEAGYITYADRDVRHLVTRDVARRDDGSFVFMRPDPNVHHDPRILVDLLDEETLVGVEFIDSDADTLALLRAFLASRDLAEPGDFVRLVSTIAAHPPSLR